MKKVYLTDDAPRATKKSALLSAATEYRALWLICHENNPRGPEAGDFVKLGHLRGALFAAIESVIEQNESKCSGHSGNGYCPVHGHYGNR